METRLRIVDERDVDPALDAAIRDGLCTCFPADAEVYSKTRAWHDSHPSWSIVIEEGEHVVTHAGVVDRTVRASNDPVHIAGIQNVFVMPAHRRQGLCERVMIAAMEEAAIRGYEAGLLFCVPQLEKVYARCGWITLAGVPVIRVDEDGNEVPLPPKNIAMFHPLTRTDWPTGTTHLQGDDW